MALDSLKLNEPSSIAIIAITIKTFIGVRPIKYQNKTRLTII